MNCPPHGICLPTRNIRVIDGDTVECDFLGGRVKVRFMDCWCAEDRDEGGPGDQAKNFLETLIEDRTDLSLYVPIESAVHRMLTFSRLLGYLFAGQRSVSEIMVSSGHAMKEKP